MASEHEDVHDYYRRIRSTQERQVRALYPPREPVTPRDDDATFTACVVVGCTLIALVFLTLTLITDWYWVTQ